MSAPQRGDLPPIFASVAGETWVEQDVPNPFGGFTRVRILFFAGKAIRIIEEDHSPAGDLTARRTYEPDRTGVFRIRVAEFYDEEGRLRDRRTYERDANGNERMHREEWDENGTKTRDEWVPA